MYLRLCSRHTSSDLRVNRLRADGSMQLPHVLLHSARLAVVGFSLILPWRTSFTSHRDWLSRVFVSPLLNAHARKGQAIMSNDLSEPHLHGSQVLLVGEELK